MAISYQALSPSASLLLLLTPTNTLTNIIGQEAGKSVIEEYLNRRDHSDVGNSSAEVPSSREYSNPRQMRVWSVDPKSYQGHQKREGSTYAGLEKGGVPLSDAEEAAEAYAKRLVDYDHNSAARTTVIYDRSDYYEIEGNSWLSMEEKELQMKKKEEMEEAERARRSKIIMTFDLVDRKVLMNEDDISEIASENRILRPPDERELNWIKPNPTLKVQPIFIDPGHGRNPTRGNHFNKGLSSIGLCLEISGRVQHDNNDLKHLMMDGLPVTS